MPDFLKLIILGGPLMLPMLIESVLALGVIIERAIAFYKNSQIDTRALRAKVLQYLEENRIDDALKLCANTPGPLSAVLMVGLQTYQKHRHKARNMDMLRNMVEKAMSDYSAQVIPDVEKRLKLLSFVASSAPLFGMTGTVTGMISAFDGMAAAASVDNSSVAMGIKEALITTAAGLLIALGAVIPYHIFTSMSARIEREIDEAGGDLLDYIIMQEDSAAHSHQNEVLVKA